VSRTDQEVLDEWLVLEVQSGRPEALQLLAERWHRRLTGYAYRRIGRPEAAAEIAQEAWIAILRGIRRLDDPARFRPWVFRIVDRKAVDWLRRHHRQEALNDRLAEDPSLSPAACDEGTNLAPEPSDSDRENEGHAQAIDQLRAALRRLPGDRRALLSMFYLDGLSVREIAEALAVPEGTVKARLFHARNALKHDMEKFR